MTERISDARHTAALQAEVEALRAEVASLPADWSKDSSLQTWFPFTAQELAAAQQRIAELERDLEAARADAARYRWLRDPCSGAERVIFYCRGDYGRGLMSSATLDAAIDAAMQRAGE